MITQKEKEEEQAKKMKKQVAEAVHDIVQDPKFKTQVKEVRELDCMHTTCCYDRTHLTHIWRNTAGG